MIITGKYPNLRMRRSRKNSWSRRLVQENSLSYNDLILPIFLTDGSNQKIPIKSMPNIYRYSIDRLSKIIDKSIKKKIPMVALFPQTKIKLKNPFVHGTLLIRKKVLLDLGGYDERFYFAQDYKLMKDLLKNNYKIGFIKEPLYLLNQENNISQIHRDEQHYYAECVKKNKVPLLR